MTHKKWTAGILLTAFTAGMAGITISQTGVPHASPFHARLQDAAITTPDFDGAQIWLMDSPRSSWPSPGDWENMTSAQREQAMRKFAEDRLRDGLKRAGYTQDDLQDAAVGFLQIVENDRRNIREKGGKLRGAVADGSSDAQISALMSDLRRAVSYARMRRDKGRKDLNTKIGFSKKPKLDAILSLYGLGGDESSYLISSFGGRGFNRRGNSGSEH